LDERLRLTAHGVGEPPDLERLVAENAELRQRVEELEQLLTSASANWDEDGFAERQREYESLLEEKSEVIRALHQKIQELQEAPGGNAAPSAAAAPPQDLMQLKEQLEDERRQLQEDEEAMMKQMQQMELAMSRERADLARQRAEVQRLHADLNHELEQAARDPGLRERLMALQRRQQDIASRKPGASAPPAPAAAPEKAPTPPAQEAPTPTKSSGSLLRRFFG
jgi:hypothetical protein